VSSYAFAYCGGTDAHRGMKSHTVSLLTSMWTQIWRKVRNSSNKVSPHALVQRIGRPDPVWNHPTNAKVSIDTIEQ
jgi:hypothetical protein